MTPARLLLLFGVIGIVAIAALLAGDGLREYRRERAAFEERLQTEARLLAEHAELAIGAADLVLRDVEERIQQVGVEGLDRDASYSEGVRRMLAGAPQLVSLLVADDRGEVRFATYARASAPIRVDDRDYFAAHRAGVQHHIGRPIVGRGSGRQLIPVSIRLRDAAGAFAGVAVVSLDVAYFERFYTSAPQKLGRRIGMYRDDGTVLSLYPAPAETWSRYAVEDVAEHFTQREGSFIGPSPLDATRRIIAHHRTESYPVIISVADEYAALLATLYPTWLRGVLTFLLFGAGTVASGIYLNRSIRAVDRAREAQLSVERKQRESERFSRAITQHLPNGRVSVLDRELRYRFIDGAGLREDSRFTPEAVLGKQLREVYARAAGETLERLVRVALEGAKAEGGIAHDGQEYRVIAVPLRDDEGRIEQALLLTQDITDLKLAQRELEVRNRELQTLSLTDGLLKIANRRAFDEAFGQEWGRAQRQQEPLALLLIDIDQFKRYNDTYGHAQGDVCLQGVAAVLEDAVGRSGDLVARYGGEEFVVLLPHADLDGALCVAERIHARLAERALPFPESSVADHVTVSIGAAALVPGQQDPASMLIEQADTGLYRAKESGRNRTEPAVRAPAGSGSRD